ncbi:hypothetical protein [Actinomycetospora sp.]|uniref:hypothetical protein n=1 Tax=Actinomycetospora sp. TaxID=1872135 RepID=UPI002F407EEF
MLDSGLRFAFAFLPAGVAIVVGLVLAVQRRRVLPAVSTPAIAGLALQLVAALLSASTVVVLPALLRSGSSPESVLTASSLIGIVTALITVLGWVLLLIALFRRLPATAPTAVSAPTPAAGMPMPAPPAPAPAPRGWQPAGDDAPTGRHALLDEHGQQVIAQEGVRLSPQAAAAGGAAAAGVAGGVAAAHAGGPDDEDDGEQPSPAHGGHAEEMPTEAVPIVGHPRTPLGTAAGRPDDEAEPAADDGPAGVDEAAVGGMPTETTTDPEADAESPAAAGPGSDGAPAAVAGAAGVAGEAAVAGSGASDAAVGGTPSGPGRQPEPADDAATETLRRPVTGQGGAGPGGAVPGGAVPGSAVPGGAGPGAAMPSSPTPAVEDQPSEPGEAGVDEAAVGGTPSAAADPPPDPSAVSVDEGAVGGVPTDAADTTDGASAPTAHHAAADEDLPDDSSEGLDSGTADPSAEPTEPPATATVPGGDDLFRPAPATRTVPAPGPAPAGAPGGPAPFSPGGPAATVTAGPGTPRPSTDGISETVSRASGTPVAEDGVGGTPTGASGVPAPGAGSGTGARTGAPDSGPGERSGLVNRARTQVAGWFEPVTGTEDGGVGDSAADGPGEAREEPPSNGHQQGS